MVPLSRHLHDFNRTGHELYDAGITDEQTFKRQQEVSRYKKYLLTAITLF